MKSALALLCDEFKELYLVIDALDECEPGLREEIVEAVVEISHQHDCIKTFITSRLETDIEEFFGRLQVPTISIKARNTADDIRNYVNDTISSLRAARKLKIQCECVEAQIIETLVRRADGMYGWCSSPKIARTECS